MFHWVAHYNDETSINQLEGGVYADIERERLVAFDLWLEDRLVVRVDLRGNDCGEGVERRRLIWRGPRHRQTNRGDHLKVWMVGWQRKVNGRNVQAINYVFEDGAVLLGGQFVEGDEFPNHAIKPLPWETDLSE